MNTHNSITSSHSIKPLLKAKSEQKLGSLSGIRSSHQIILINQPPLAKLDLKQQTNYFLIVHEKDSSTE